MTNKKKNSAGKSEQDKLPGYPHYHPEKDIMNPKNNLEKKLYNENSEAHFEKKEYISSSKRGVKKTEKEIMEYPFLDNEESIEHSISVSENDVTNEELELLGTDELNTDMGDDEELKRRVWPVDMTGADLDFPDVDEEDEENNNFSIGGDRHDDLDEDRELGR